MNKILTIGLAAAAVVVAVFVGAQFFGSPSGGLGSDPSPTAEATATPEPTPTPEPAATPLAVPPLTQSFTSTQHGITVSYPEGWTARAATGPWTDPTFPLEFGQAIADFLYDPVLESDLFVTIASQPIGDATPEDWVGGQMASDEGCGTATEPITVDGASGLIGTDCNVAVVTTDGRGYWIQFYTGSGAPLLDDRAWFEALLATVQLQPENAVD